MSCKAQFRLNIDKKKISSQRITPRYIRYKSKKGTNVTLDTQVRQKKRYIKREEFYSIRELTTRGHVLYIQQLQV